MWQAHFSSGISSDVLIFHSMTTLSVKTEDDWLWVNLKIFILCLKCSGYRCHIHFKNRFTLCLNDTDVCIVVPNSIFFWGKPGKKWGFFHLVKINFCFFRAHKLQASWTSVRMVEIVSMKDESWQEFAKWIRQNSLDKENLEVIWTNI